MPNLQMPQIKSFLDEFTKELIENYSMLFLKKEIVLEEKLERGAAQPNQPMMLQMPKVQQAFIPAVPQPALQISKPRMQPLLSSVHPQAQKPMLLQRQQQYQPSSSILIPSGKAGFDKLIQLLNDASITRIEYQSGSKPLMITRFGQTFPSKTIVAEGEAMEILEEFSKQAKIPLVKGIFRVNVRNLMVFAVVSDFIKPRFVIQKTREF